MVNGNMNRVVVLLVMLVVIILPLVSATPFPVPGRPLQSRHKQMHVSNVSSAHTQAQLFTAASAATSAFTLSDGDTVTCIPIENQPSLSPFNNPQVQLKPSMHPDSGGSSTDNNGAKTATQVFAKEYKKCPKGQIPVRRARNSDLDTTGQLSATQGMQSPKRNYVHQHAYTATTISHPPAYKGTQVVLNVWQPFVEPHDFSLAQLWVMNTGLSFNPGSDNWPMNTIEAGWQVYSDLYGDKQPRLFVYWTGDGYVNTGCYNLNQDCPDGSQGFVQVSSKVLLGGSIAPPSQADSDQYEIKLRVFKDDESGNWWLQFNQEYVGYWPRALFHSLKDTSDLIQWGGEVFDVRDGVGQTQTVMGSGALSSSGFGQAAYQRNLQYVSLGNTMYDVTDLQDVSTDPSCYTVSPGSNQAWALNVHEGPQSVSARFGNMTGLVSGMIVSNEPGYYEDRAFGIRIENLLIVREEDTANRFGGVTFLGFERLTFLPIQAKMLDLELMSDQEIKWLNDYHAEVWNKVSPLVEGNARNWLHRNSRPIVKTGDAAATEELATISK